MVNIDEHGRPELEPGTGPTRHNAGILIRGETGALEELIKTMDEKAELLDVQVVFVKRSPNWITIIDGRPDEICGGDRGNEP